MKKLRNLIPIALFLISSTVISCGGQQDRTDQNESTQPDYRDTTSVLPVIPDTSMDNQRDTARKDTMPE